MVKKYNRLGLLYGIPGVILQFFIFVPKMQYIGWIGAVLLITGMSYYAKSIGYHPAWGLLGLLSWVGVGIIMSFKDKTLTAQEAVKPKKMSPVIMVCGIIALLIILLFVYAAIVSP